MQQVMLDIETLGLEPGAAIVSIGAVKFGPDGLGEEFHRGITIESCAEHGLEVDMGTLSWWLEQEDEAQEELTGGWDLDVVLEQFTNWYGDADEVWACSPSMDCEVMEAAYEAAGLEEPWEYDEERDHRTIRELPQAEEPEQVGTEHNALDDAIYQAMIAQQVLEEVGSYDE